MTKTRTSAAAKNRYNRKAYDRIALMVPKGTKQVCEVKKNETFSGNRTE